MGQTELKVQLNINNYTKLNISKKYLIAHLLLSWNNLSYIRAKKKKKKKVTSEQQ